MNQKLKGTGVAIVTPFNEDKSIDYASLKNLINYVIDGGVNFVVFQGTTGEAATLCKNEKIESLEFVIEIINNKVPLVFGYGGNNTQQMLNQFHEYSIEKTDALLIASPYYNKPSQEGIYQHYKLLSEKLPKPIILYNVPSRTSSNIIPETTLRLAREFKNIIGIKEASGNLMQMSNLVKNKPKNFLILSGDDDLIFPQMTIGLDGVISVLANAYPSQVSSLVKYSNKGELLKAQKIYYDFLDFIPLLFKDGNPAGIKSCLYIQQIIQNNELRLPLVPVSQNIFNQIKEFVIKYN